MTPKMILEISIHLDSDRFRKLIHKISPELVPVQNDEFADLSMTSKGIAVRYRDSLYKKKITLVVDAFKLTRTAASDPVLLCEKLRKRINNYSLGAITLDDFTLSRVILISDIDVESRSRVSDYVRVLKRIRMVKGFSPAEFEGIAEGSGLFLKGNSNGIDFMIYDLENRLSGISNASEDFKGILRAEVHLVSQKTIARFTDSSDVEFQISQISAVSDEIFLRVFSRIIPRGNFYKKQEACELVRQKVADPKLCRLMLKLITLIPEKKSLLLAQKALDSRRVDEVMDEFERIGVCPVTIGKREHMDKLQAITELYYNER